VTLPARWSCRIVTHPTHELSTAPASAAGQDSHSDHTASHCWPLPAVLLTVGDEVLAALGFRIEPDGTLAITQPTFVNCMPTSTQSLMLEEMLKAVHVEARRLHLRTIRSVLPAANDHGPSEWTWMNESLTRCGFLNPACIIQWKTSSSRLKSTCSVVPRLSGESSPAYQHESAEVISRGGEKYRFLGELVRAILAESEDLSRMPAASAQTMIKTWSDQKAAILVGHVDSAPAGLAVWTVESGSGADPNPVIQLQYIGVRPELRQRGLASRLLAQVIDIENQQRQRPTVGHCQSGELRITAFADQTNQPATLFYRHCGFREDAIFAVWCRNV